MSVTTKSIIAVSAAAFLALIGIVSTAEAGRGGGARMGGGGIHMGGSAKFHTNQGGKYGYRGGGGSAKFHTNQGLKYGYRGSGGKFHTNQGGKYRGWSGKFDNDRHHGKYGHYRRYGYPWYGLPLYTYGGGCGWLYRQAVATGSDYWWDRYYRCTGSYY